MASLREQLAADYAAAIGGYEQKFQWEGTWYPCVRTTEPAALESGPGGDELMVSDRITAALAVFKGGVLPKQGDFIDGYKLQVQRADPNFGHVVLWCAPPLNLQETS